MTPAQNSSQAPYSVTALTDSIRLHLEQEYDWIQVQGEISNFKKAPSGHAYFRLKDEGAVLECVAWKSTVVRWAGLDLQDGDEVIAGGKITVYPRRGQYQLVVSAIRLAGMGVLQQRFEALKRRLAEEGLFDPAAKKNLPAFPRKVAIITSPTGAAVRDFLRTVYQGHCPVRCVICPVLVQGEEAAGEIAAMIERVNQKSDVDLIVVCRGGGSLEDLWAFNEEIVARAIFLSQIPVISAVGHEVDFTISDFVADVRAATPTAAGQILCDLFAVHRGDVDRYRDRLLRSLGPALNREKERLEVTQKALQRYHPTTVITQLRQRLDDSSAGLMRVLKNEIQQTRTECHHYRKALEQSILYALNNKRQSLLRLDQFLHSLNPSRNLERGYSICRHKDGRLVQSLGDVQPTDEIRIRVSDGTFQAEVLNKEKE